QQLQPLDVALLTHHFIVQRLQGVVLESQAALQLGDTLLDPTHASPSPNRKSSVSTKPSLSRMPCSSATEYGCAGCLPHTGAGQAASLLRRTITCMCNWLTMLPRVATFILSAAKVSLRTSASCVVSCQSWR